MKKFSFSIVAVSLAALLWTSCIDNAVSPEVQAIRAAQVDLIKARTAYQDAQTAQQAALTAFQLIVNDEEKEDLRERVAQADVNVAEYKVQLKDAELALQVSTEALAKHLATQKLTDAASYLTSYTTESTLLSTLFATKATKETELAKAQMLLNAIAGPDQNVAFDLLKIEFQRDLATAQATLTAEQGALTALQAVAADPSTTQTALNTANATKVDLANKALQLAVDKANATKVKDDAKKKRDDAATAISDYNGKVVALAQNANNIVAKQKTITDQQKVVSDLAISLTTKTAELVPYDAELSTRKAAYDAILATVTALYNTWQIEENKLAAALLNNPAASTTARDNAKNNFQATTAAGAGATDPASPTVGSDLEKAKTAFNNINNQYGVAQPAKVLKDAIATLSNPDPATVGSIAKAQADLAVLQTDLSNLNVTKADLTAEKAALDAANTDAVANLETYKTAYETALNAIAPIDTKIADNTAADTAIGGVITALNSFLSTATGINTAIETKKTAVETATRAVGAAQKALADNDISKAEATTKIQDLQADLVSINDQITAKTALVAKWKALLDAALA